MPVIIQPVIIQNISKKYSRKGMQDYVILINEMEVCRLQHRSEDGLSTLLFRSAYAVEEKEIARLFTLREKIKQLQSMSKTTKKGNK